MQEANRASTSWMFSSPGIPKTYSTPSFSGQRTISRATEECDNVVRLTVLMSGPFLYTGQAATFAKKASISSTSRGLRRKSAAPTTPRTWPGRRAPTIAPVTAGLCSTQATATSAGV